MGFSDTQVQTSQNGQVLIRSRAMDNTTESNIVAEMNSRFGQVEVQQFDSVGPAVGREVAGRAAEAVGLAAIGILAYITFAFRGVPHAFRFGVAAIIAMLHDVAVVIGIEAILGHFIGWEVDALFLTALLTVIGFSVHDTIVVFDRIRENAANHRRLPFDTIVNHSIIQTLDRSINTQLVVMLTLLSLALFGGVTIRHFVVILLVGVFSGTYSSIFNASPILVVWENRDWEHWFHRSSQEAAA
jgi:preprotein translocase subunit SecF